MDNHALRWMPRITSAFGAVLALFLPLGRPLLLGVTPVIGLGAALLSMQKAHAQSAAEWLDSGNNKSRRGNYQDGIADYNKAIDIKPNFADAYLHLKRVC